MANSSETPTKKTSTILFTDIVGFSKKINEDEIRAYELLRTHDALIRVLTAKYDGKTIKSLGDSYYIDFSNPVNAIKCAVELQKRFWNFNRDKPEFDTIIIRAGLHYGSLSFRKENIFGEAITVASRIESLAEPYRIFISSELYEQVKDVASFNTFKIGQIELNDISRTVEIFEILIDSIPELAVPSKTAQNISAAQKNLAALKREAEELNEAKRIEEQRQRVLDSETKGEEERQKQIYTHYKNAEEFLNLGDIDGAERELAEVARLESTNKIQTIQKKEEEEEDSGILIKKHIRNAKELLLNKELDAAEREINEVFRLQPLNLVAQQIQLQIEEERYLLEEKKQSKFETVTEQESEETKKINNLLAHSRLLLQEEKFTEATLTLHEIFRINPNHSGARRLEENIKQAEQTKAELLRIQYEQKIVTQPSKKLERLQSIVEEKKKQKLILPAIIEKEPIYKKLNYWAAIIIAIMVVYLCVPMLIDLIVPKKATIAILRFTNAPRDSSDTDLLDALPVLLAEDFSRCKNITVISPSSSFQFISDQTQFKRIVTYLPAKYYLVGYIQENRGYYTVIIRLLIPELQRVVYVGVVEGTITELSAMRTEIIKKVLEKIDVKSPIPEITQPSNKNAFLRYIKALRYIQLQSSKGNEIAKNNLRIAVQIDPTFGLAHAKLAFIDYSEFQKTNKIELLESAIVHAQRTIKFLPNAAEANLVLAASSRHSQNYDESLSYLTKCLKTSPQNPDCFRELTLLAIIAGKKEIAKLSALKSIEIDPKNVKSYFSLGLAYHFEQKYSQADSLYNKAQSLDFQDTILTTNFAQNAWMGEKKFDKVVQYCQEMLRVNPNDYRYYYWMGRAYQLSFDINTGQLWLEEGLKLIKHLKELKPDDATVRAYSSLFYSRLGKFSEGESAMRDAISIDSVSTPILYLKANLYSIQKNKEKAIEAFRKALAQEYNFSEILNPDLSFISYEPEFASLITRKTSGKWPLD